MTTTYKNNITTGDMGRILDPFQTHLRKNGVKICIFAAFTVLFSMLIDKIPSLWLGIEGNTAYHLFAALQIADLAILVCLLLYMLKEVKAKVACDNMRHHNVPNEACYATLEKTFRAKKVPKSGTWKADAQELLFALWLCSYSDKETVTIEPGHKPWGRTTVKIEGAETKTFLLPEENRVLRYITDVHFTKQIFLEGGRN